MSTALDELKIDVQKATLQRIPTTPVEFSEEQLEDIEKLLDKIEEDEDVQQVFTNIAWSFLMQIFWKLFPKGDGFFFWKTPNSNS